jgi:phosphoglycerol transferase MdoB-like AlkP superfamily enzyme
MLQCDHLGFTRQATYDDLIASKNMSDAPIDMLFVSFLLLVILIIFTPIFTFTLTNRRKMARNVVFAVFSPALVAINIAMYLTLPSIGTSNKIIKSKLTKMSVLDLCADIYSRADLAGYEKDLHSLTFEATATEWVTKCIWFSLACVGIMLLGLVILNSKKVAKERTTKDDSNKSRSALLRSMNSS